MFGFLTNYNSIDRDPLINHEAAEEFSRSLPLDDPFKTLQALCDALSMLATRPALDINQLGVLLALDRRTERLREDLLGNSIKRGLRSWPPDGTIWRSILQLSNAFAGAYEHFLRRIREKASSRTWLECTPPVLVQLFRHRQVESLLSLFLYEQLGPSRWRELHDAYLFAHLRNLSKSFVSTSLQESTAAAGTTLERQYLHILLLQLMNNGQFMPREAFWARRWITAWSSALSLESEAAKSETCLRDDGFVVDLRGAEGLKRPPTEVSKAHLHLDPTSMLTLIDDEIKSLRNPVVGADGLRPPGSTAKLALLAKLRTLYSPQPVWLKRRGERKAFSLLATQVLDGLPSIVGMLYEESQRTPGTSSSSVPEAEEITITDIGGGWRAAEGDSQAGGSLLTEAGGPSLHAWRIKNRSESGALLRGRVDDHNRMIPGSLIAFRDSDRAHWVVAVVRRLRKFVRNNIEIAIEHIGRDPQGVTIAVGSDLDFPLDTSRADAHGRFAALFLRECTGYPKVPIKTLLLPAREFKFGGLVSLLSTTTSYTLRLKEPLESQAEFVWAPFEVVNKEAAQGVLCGQLEHAPY